MRRKKSLATPQDNNKSNAQTKSTANRNKLLPRHCALLVSSCMRIALLFLQTQVKSVELINISPHEFENFVGPCFGNSQRNYAPANNNYASSSSSMYSQSSQRRPNYQSGNQQQFNDLSSSQYNRSRYSQDSSSSSSYATSTNQDQPYNNDYSSNSMSSSNYNYNNNNNNNYNYNNNNNNYLGQDIPRAQTMDNFISLVMKLEATFPNLAKDVDRFVRMLLTRFHYDNYYYDELERKHEDKRTKHDEIVYHLLNGLQQAESFREYALDQNEKCSLYFMLSHFVKQPKYYNPLANRAPMALANERLASSAFKAPNLQAAGSSYPSRSANAAFSGVNGKRYSGPSPGYGSSDTSSMNSFGSGVSTNVDSNSNSYGMNVPPQVNPYTNRQTPRVDPTVGNSAYASVDRLNNKQPYTINASSGYGSYSSSSSLNNYSLRQNAYFDAAEFGVVTASNDNSAIALNRVLYGILGASIAPQPIKQVSDMVYQNQETTTTYKGNEEIDPLYATTLGELWARLAESKSDSSVDSHDYNGFWNNSMCPTHYSLYTKSIISSGSKDIPVTTAELLGGLDGFNLGILRRKMRSSSAARRPRLSDLLKTYYSRQGFKPNFPGVGVCSRNDVLTYHQELRRTAENYLRVIKMNSPTPDSEISQMIQRAESSFKDSLQRAATTNAPQSICEPVSGFADETNQCEIPKLDLVVVFDSSQQSDQDFMNLVALKLSRRIGVSRSSSSLTLLSNQQDSSGFGGSQNFNSIVRNSTNTAEIGCAISFDGTRSYQGGQISDPIRLVQMFEQTLINLDDDPSARVFSSSSKLYNQRQQYASSNIRNSPSLTSFSEYSVGNYEGGDNSNLPKTTSGAKAIVYFNYGQPLRPSSYSSFPQQTINYPPGSYGSQSRDSSDREYQLYEAKKNLHDNYVGAVIIGLATNREDIRQLVHDENRDIIDIQQSSSGSAMTFDSGSVMPDLFNRPELNSLADQTVDRILNRLCDVPAEFKYPQCYRVQSSNVESTGYITQGKSQQWMMAPKTFFSSRTIRMVFRVQGGRLRVCFGRDPRPDSNGRGKTVFSSSSASFQSFLPPDGSIRESPLREGIFDSSNNYNLYGNDFEATCKDLNQGQEADFIVEEPCGRQSISECKPFYFSIRETSSPGEIDPNYLCLDSGCKRLDQVIFTLSHTGVACNSSFKSGASFLLLAVCTIFGCLSYFNAIDDDSPDSRFNFDYVSETLSELKLQENKHATIKHEIKPHSCNRQSAKCIHKKSCHSVLIALTTIYTSLIYACNMIVGVSAQQAGVYDFGQNRYGEKRGNLTPHEVLAIILLIMTVLAGLVFTIALCYYVLKQDKKKDNNDMEPVEQDDY